ncbi:hypothetical protein Q7P37_003653 [Cladosporium fusiforme]
MPPPPPPSNIRAFVHWREPSIYAGEDIECIITFKNIATPPGHEPQEKDDAHTPHANGFSRAPSAAASRRSSLVQSSVQASWAPSFSGSRKASQPRGHRPALSLNVLSAPSRGGPHSTGLHSAPMPSRTPTSARPAKGHGRSLSIMSLGSEAPSESRVPAAPVSSKRPTRGHGRSTSLQVSSKPPPLPSPYIVTTPTSFRHPSPLNESFTPQAAPGGQGEPASLQPPRRRPGTVSADFTPRPGGHRRSPSAMSGGLSPNFEFPPRQQPAAALPSPQHSPPKPIRNPSNMHSSQNRGVSPRPPEGWSGPMSNLNPLSRVITESSAGGTPRSSGEFYSMDNQSDETLASELPYQNQANGRLLPSQSHSYQASRSRQPSITPAEPETLMMGHAQTMGHFTLEGSLVNGAPFEDVKRKGVQGGGGVVGVERSKRASGMFGAFSWGNLGESIGGLLGGDDMSSIAQMKAAASSKVVPLLSTPQSLLFVDLCLAPGESASYHYRFALPRGLPPSFRGRAIKVSYHISLGIQRPGGQPVKQIEIPFRVLGSVNSRGEVLGHDLMSPYIILQDSARTKSISTPQLSTTALPSFPAKGDPKQKPPKQGLEDFLRYTERLLESPMDENGALLSPTSPLSPAMSPSVSRRQSHAEPQPTTTKETIDFAILRSNRTSQPGTSHSSNRFNISRSGQPVAVLTVLRPAYRLGETIIGTIDFTTPAPSPDDPKQGPTYSVNLELESAERVDPSLALRSSTSIQRVTRKVHASTRENALFARSISFSLTVPAQATPSFETTGVSLVWSLRVEFTTERQPAAQMSWPEERQEQRDELLEEIGRDDRGASLLAKERLMAETFEIAVPLKIYGAQGVEGLGGEPDVLEL